MLNTLLLAVVLHAAPPSPLSSPSLAPLPSAATLVSAQASRADSVRADDEIRLVALRHAGEIQRCYETQGLRVNPSLAGLVEVELKVLPSGRVDSASVATSALAGPGREEVESCITMTVRNWRFERGPFVTEMIVYPFNLVRERAGVVNTRA